LFAGTKSIVQNALSTQRRLIKTYKTERFVTALEAEPQGYADTFSTLLFTNP